VTMLKHDAASVRRTRGAHRLGGDGQPVGALSRLYEPEASARCRQDSKVGLAADFFYNVVLATLLFCELPQEWLFTGRLQRYLRDPNAGQAWWMYSRKTVARWLCDNLLDPFDPSGNHCG